MTLAITDGTGKLKVRIPARGEDPLPQILLAIAHKGVIRASYKKLKRNVALNQGKILEVADAVLPYEREDLAVQIADEGYQALVQYTPGGTIPTPPSFFEMLWILVHSRVTVGIEFDELDRIAGEHDFTRAGQWVVAKGRRHVPGKPARLEFHVSTEISHAPLLLADGRVDYKNIEAIPLVGQDQLLATKHPPTAGTPGLTVTGRTVEVEPGRDIPLPAGQNTSVSEDGRTLTAKNPGHLYAAGGLLHVERVLVIRGNVDFSTGNLRFAGDVVVLGDVISGFEVESDGSLFVKGRVEAGRLVARKGNIEVLGGVFGNGRAELSAARNLKLDFADNARLSAGEDVVVNKYLTNCRTSAGRAVQVHGSGGAIIGGQVVAGQRILASVAGSETSGRTQLSISSREGELEGLVLEQIEAELMDLSEDLRECEKAAALLVQLKGDLSSLTLAQRQKVSGMARRVGELRARLAKQEERKAEAQQRRNRLKFDAIRIEREVFPGTQISILGATHHVGEHRAGAIFGLSEEGEIVLNR